jgi:hypothetical protein
MPFIGELGVITREREAHRWRQCQQSASQRMPHPAVALRRPISRLPDLSQNMGYPPAPSFGQPRPQAVIDKVGFTVDKIRAAGKVAGTLVTADELPYWLEKGVQFFYVHSDPFLRLGLNGIKKSLGR